MTRAPDNHAADPAPASTARPAGRSQTVVGVCLMGALVVWLGVSLLLARDPYTKDLWFESQRRLVDLARAIEAETQDGSEPPPSLLTLPVEERVLLDPFTDERFEYLIHPEGADADWALVGAGPDRRLNFQRDPFEAVLYDPTNGLRSEGDMIVIEGAIPERPSNPFD